MLAGPGHVSIAAAGLAGVPGRASLTAPPPAGPSSRPLPRDRGGPGPSPDPPVALRFPAPVRPRVEPGALQQFALAFPALLFSLVAHEVAHAWVALQQGDTTARDLGRITLNPAKHIDPVMTVLVPALLFVSTGGAVWFGGAKPVPVQPRNYRHYKRGDILVSLAGVTTNFVLAFVFAILAALVGLALRGDIGGGAVEWVRTLFDMVRIGIYVNLGLCAFNLLPIPPLDGSHVFKYLLPPAWAQQYVALGRMGFVVLLLALWVARPLIALWMAPAFALGGWLERIVMSVVMRG